MVGNTSKETSCVTDVKALIEWLQGRINTLESVNHALESDDEYTLLACKVALQSISDFLGKDNLVQEKTLMFTGLGINSLVINGEVRHITDLDPLTLSAEWSKLVKEKQELYEANKKACSGWRGFVLKLLGIKLPQKPGVMLTKNMRGYAK
ncbi:Uncharacterised protein [Shigella sonnei]|nr:hypothetical protein [Shigella sonnei]SJJ58338.1 Uncharacterised protein [Shigella sonnei]